MTKEVFLISETLPNGNEFILGVGVIDLELGCQQLEFSHSQKEDFLDSLCLLMNEHSDVNSRTTQFKALCLKYFS